MFESNPKTVGDMMAVVNKHADMEDAERAHRRHKTKNDSSKRPSQRDNHPELLTRLPSTSAREEARPSRVIQEPG